MYSDLHSVISTSTNPLAVLMKYTERHCSVAAFSCKFSIFMRVSFNIRKWVITELNTDRDLSREAWEEYYNLRMCVIN